MTIEMTAEQKELFNALTTLQGEIALNSLSGMNDIDSYKASSGKAKTVTAMETSVGQILRNREVVLFMDSIKVNTVSSAIMTRIQMLENLTRLAELSATELKNGLEVIAEFKGGYDVKMKAMDMISKIQGFESATKFEVKGRLEIGAIDDWDDC
jgi:hypothetical protein